MAAIGLRWTASAGCSSKSGGLREARDVEITRPTSASAATGGAHLTRRRPNRTSRQHRKDERAPPVSRAGTAAGAGTCRPRVHSRSPPRAAAGFRSTAARDPRCRAARWRRVAPRDEVRRLSHPVPDREGAGHSPEPQCQGLDRPVPRRRGRRDSPSRAASAPRRRDRRPPAERHHQLPGPPERRRRARAALLLRLRSPAPRRAGPDGRDARGAEARPGGAGRLAVCGGDPLQHPRRRPGRGVLPPGLPALAGGHRRQAARRPVRARSRAELAQGEVHPGAGVRHRRVHRAQGVARRPGRPAPRGQRRGRRPRLRGEGRHGLHRLRGREPPQATRQAAGRRNRRFRAARPGARRPGG